MGSGTGDVMSCCFFGQDGFDLVWFGFDVNLFFFFLLIIISII